MKHGCPSITIRTKKRLLPITMQLSVADFFIIYINFIMVLSKEGGKEVRDYEIVPGPDLMYTDQGRVSF